MPTDIGAGKKRCEGTYLSMMSDKRTAGDENVFADYGLRAHDRARRDDNSSAYGRRGRYVRAWMQDRRRVPSQPLKASRVSTALATDRDHGRSARGGTIVRHNRSTRHQGSYT